jgi:putative SOS response-associated peptidase YedK
MCGRYGRRGDKQRIAEWMQTHKTNVFEEFDETNLAPSFNVAPQSFQPVVRLRPETGERKLIQLSRWWSGGLSGLRSDRRTLECDEEFAGHRQREIARLP